MKKHLILTALFALAAVFSAWSQTERRPGTAPQKTKTKSEHRPGQPAVSDNQDYGVAAKERPTQSSRGKGLKKGHYKQKHKYAKGKAKAGKKRNHARKQEAVPEFKVRSGAVPAPKPVNPKDRKVGSTTTRRPASAKERKAGSMSTPSTSKDRKVGSTPTTGNEPTTTTTPRRPGTQPTPSTTPATRRPGTQPAAEPTPTPAPSSTPESSPRPGGGGQ